MSSKHRNTDYATDSLIGAGADIEARPDEQAAVARLLRGMSDAEEMAQMLGVAS